MDKKSVRVPFMFTYHPHLKNVSKIITKHIKHLHADSEVRSVFTPLPFVSFRFLQNLRNHLVKSKLYPQKQKISSSKCNSPRCFTSSNMKERDIFTSHVTKEIFKISNHFNCNSKCFIYLFSCKLSGKQYVESTTDNFRYRWNNYKNCQCNAERWEDHMQRYLHEHFLRKDRHCLLNNVEITLIDKIDQSDTRRWEEFWRTKLRTLAPLGLNIDE